MNSVLLSTAYFPPISWVAVAFSANEAIIEVHETYPKQTYRNRCHLATASGILTLSVPVIRTYGNHTRSIDIQIDNTSNWQKTHWRSIISAYNKTPYFIYFKDIFGEPISKKYKYLIDLNATMLDCITQVLKIAPIGRIKSVEFEKSPEIPDYRNAFDAKTRFHSESVIALPRYIQAFEPLTGFLNDLSILDLIFNIGNESVPYLKEVAVVLKKS